MPSKAPALARDSTAWGLRPARPTRSPGLVKGPLFRRSSTISLDASAPTSLMQSRPSRTEPLWGVHGVWLWLMHGLRKGTPKRRASYLSVSRGLEAHRLVVEEGDEELEGLLALQPGGLVGGDREGVGVRFGEHVVAVDLGEDPPGSFAVPAGAFQEPLPVGGDEMLPVGSGEGPP